MHVCETKTIRKYCCQENEFLWNNTFCSGGQKINMQCDGDVTTLSNEFYEYWNYKIIPNDDGTKTTLHATAGYIIREEHYCIGLEQITYEENVLEVALICDQERINMNELEDKSMTNVSLFTSLLIKALLIFNVMSTIALAITIFIYSFLKEVQDIQGKCIFHLSLNMFCVHGGISYIMIFDSIGVLLPNACITSLYVEIYFLLAVFTWCTVLGYHSWIQTKVKIFVEDDRRIHKYRLFGYGVPALMILLCNIAAHAEKLYTKFEFELECYKHQTGILLICVILPILILSIANCFFFFATQIRLWNSDLLPQHSKKSTSRMMKNRLILSGKLLILTGTTFSLCTVIYTIQFIVGILEIFNGQRIISKFLIILSVLMTTVTSAEGIFVFLIVVVFRKRVLKGIAGTSFSFSNRFIPEKWKTMVDPETTDDSDAENGNENLQHENL